MSRILVGPFNRVEGDLELKLDIADGRIEASRVTTTLYRGFEQLLRGRPPLDALAIAPRICGICSVSQSVAAAAALRAFVSGDPPPNGAYVTNLAHAAENIADHLTHFYIFFMPDFAREAYAGRPWYPEIAERFKATSGSATRDALPARKSLLESMGLLAGKWPHSLAFQPGGVTRAVDMGERVRLLALIAEFQTFLEDVLFGVSLDTILSLESLDELQAYAEGPGARGDFGRFMRIAEDLGLAQMGKGPGGLLAFGAYHGPTGALFPGGVFHNNAPEALNPSAILEHVAASWFDDTPAPPLDASTTPAARKPEGYSWAKAPRYGGQPMETGAFARQFIANHPLVLDCHRRDGGSSVRGRIIARVLEIAQLTHAMGGWVRALRLKEPFCVQPHFPDAGHGIGLVEAARGALGHWLRVEEGRLTHYQIIAPTTWNFSPRDDAGVPGPLEQALEGLEIGSLAGQSPAIQHVVRSFDPCMVCTAH